MYVGVSTDPTPPTPPPCVLGLTRFGIENKDALMPDCGVHCLWFAFVCFLIRSHTPPAAFTDPPSVVRGQTWEPMAGEGGLDGLDSPPLPSNPIASPALFLQGGGGISRREYFAVGNFVFQMCAKFPAQFSGHCAK